ncbi:MAG: hypothetical protein RIC35_25295 [Marinoscillum sp.]
MKHISKTIFAVFFGLILVNACNSSRTNTEADREATYVHEGDTINPTEGQSEGSAGKKYMETTETDSGKVEQ